MSECYGTRQMGGMGAMRGTAQIIRGNALALPLADASVDLICTSPPYFGLRSYQDDGAHYDGQLGSEATPTEFVDALIAATREMVRVLKPSGSIWVNLGDKYALNNRGSGYAREKGLKDAKSVLDKAQIKRDFQGIREKSLIGVPWRYALRCIDTTQGVPVHIVREMVSAVYNGSLDPDACDEILRDYEAGGRNAGLGLIWRAEVIWSKPNGLPESVTDRVRRSHEVWFHFVKQPRYFSAVDEIREGYSETFAANHKPGSSNGSKARGQSADSPLVGTRQPPNPLGKLPSSVWTINEGESLVRSVLTAVAAGGLSPDEGERILTWTQTGSGKPSTRAASAGNGSGCSTETGTADTTRSASKQPERTGSPTRSASDQSPTTSPSTTFAGTSDVFDPTTLSPSRSASTSSADPSPSFASTATSSQMRTLTSAQEAAESAAHVCVSGCVNGEHVSGPPSTWVIPTQPLQVPPELGIDHFAAFPLEWPRRIIQGWSPSGVCTACGEGRRPVRSGWEFGVPQHPVKARALAAARNAGVTAESVGGTYGLKVFASDNTSDGDKSVGTAVRKLMDDFGIGRLAAEAAIGYTQKARGGYACACPDTTAPTTPSTVLDPFGGTGTTALVAKALGRYGISVDLSFDYCRLAEWRTTDPGQLAAALQVEKPDPVHPDQLDLFGGVA